MPMGESHPDRQSPGSLPRVHLPTLSHQQHSNHTAQTDYLTPTIVPLPVSPRIILSRCASCSGMGVACRHNEDGIQLSARSRKALSEHGGLSQEKENSSSGRRYATVLPAGARSWVSCHTSVDPGTK